VSLGKHLMKLHALLSLRIEALKHVKSGKVIQGEYHAFPEKFHFRSQC
jgi:hypothetical protein